MENLSVDVLKRHAYAISALNHLNFALHKVCFPYQEIPKPLKHTQCLELTAKLLGFKSFKGLISSDTSLKEIELSFKSTLHNKIKQGSIQDKEDTVQNTFAYLLYAYFDKPEPLSISADTLILEHLDKVKWNEIALCTILFNYPEKVALYTSDFTEFARIKGASNGEYEAHKLFKTIIQCSLLNKADAFLFFVSQSHPKVLKEFPLFGGNAINKFESFNNDILKKMNEYLSPFFRVQNNYSILNESLNSILGYWYTHVILDKNYQNIINMLSNLFPDHPITDVIRQAIVDALVHLRNTPYQFKISLSDLSGQLCLHQSEEVRRYNDCLQYLLHAKPNTYAKIFNHTNDIEVNINSVGRQIFKEHPQNNSPIRSQSQIDVINRPISLIECAKRLSTDKQLLEVINILLAGSWHFMSAIQQKAPLYTYHYHRPSGVTEKAWQIALDLIIEFSTICKQIVKKHSSNRIKLLSGDIFCHIEGEGMVTIKYKSDDVDKEISLSTNEASWYFNVMTYNEIMNNILTNRKCSTTKTVGQYNPETIGFDALRALMMYCGELSRLGLFSSEMVKGVNL